MAVKINGFVVPEDLMKLLSSMASNWADVINKNMLKVVHLSGAMTNEVYRISWPTKREDDDRIVLVRIYGEGVDLFFNRDEEIRTSSAYRSTVRGLGFLAGSQKGELRSLFMLRYLTLSADDLRDPKTSALIAAKLREFHNLDMPGSRNVFLWDRMRNWLNEAKNLCSSEQANEYRIDTLEEEIDILEKELSRNCQEVGFCHNDLQYGNIMIDEETRSITIIDYEYASYNPVAYDLANHFCEMAANYHTETPHVLNYSLYPGLEERRRFVRIYLSSSGNQPSDTEVEQLVNDAEKYALANHLFWGLWGMISSYVNNIEFDYMEYARQRFQQYRLRKPKLLGTSKVSINGD